MPESTPTDTYEVVYDMASVIIVVIIFVLLALAILFICQNGGWQGGCGGNCASCHHHDGCEQPKSNQNT